MTSDNGRRVDSPPPLRALLDQSTAPGGLTLDARDGLGERFAALQMPCVARICFGSAAELAVCEDDGGLGEDLRHKARAMRAAPQPESTWLARRVVAKAFLSPLSGPRRRLSAATPTALPLRGPPAMGSVAAYAEWARNRIDGFLIQPRTLHPDDRYLRVLRRFGSFTPLLHPDRDYALGGGYFLAYEGLGIAIDPGHSFIQNLFASGHVLGDIDRIVITHAHDDHMTDLIGLHSLLHQQRKLRPRSRPVRLFWNQGAARYFRASRSSWGKCLDEVVLQPSTTRDPVSPTRFGPYGRHRLTVLPAKHTDLTNGQGVGIGLRLSSQSRMAHTVLYTGDTGWSPRLQKAYAPYRGHCDLLLLHLGGIGRNEHRVLDPDANLSDCLYDKHLGLIGTTLLIDAVRPKKAIVSEFGEELDGLEHAIVRILQREFRPLGVQVEAARLYEQHGLEV